MLPKKKTANEYNDSLTVLYLNWRKNIKSYFDLILINLQKIKHRAKNSTASFSYYKSLRSVLSIQVYLKENT